jgi:adenine-specific DNA methylase
MNSFTGLAREVWQEAERCREAVSFAREDFTIHNGQKSAYLLRRGVRNYLDLFSSRQLLYLEQAIRCLPQADPLVRLNLALLVSTSLEFNSLLCGYKGKSPRRAGAVRHAFSHHAYSIPYTALENNPIYPHKASGTLRKLFQSRIAGGRRWAAAPRERVAGTPDDARFVTIAGELDQGQEAQSIADLASGSRRMWLGQGSATKLPLPDDVANAIVTDPPYFDSVQYGDLSAFFRVWLRRMLPSSSSREDDPPWLPLDWDYDQRDAAVSPDNGDRESRYGERLAEIFAECRRVLKSKGGRLIFTFHHWNPLAWSALTIALKTGGFVLLNRYVVHSEHPISVHISNMNALRHDTILVLAPADGAPPISWSRPSKLDTSDSAGFCGDCGTLLGALLASELDAGQIADAWRQAIDRSAGGTPANATAA